MKTRTHILPLFIFFLVISLGVFLLSKNQMLLGQGILGNALFPVESLVYQAVRLPFTIGENPEVKKLQAQNADLQRQLVHLQEVQNDNKALRDQFETTTIATTRLLPSHIIGMPAFVPGIAGAEELILDKGKADGVKKGQAVVYKDSLIGIVKDVTDRASRVILLSNKASLFTAQTNGTNALGVVKGLGNGQMVLDNVVLSDSLQIGDSVVTKGDVSGSTIPQGLIVGKIISVEKNPAAIFQRASLQSLVKVEKLTEVFILTQ